MRIFWIKSIFFLFLIAIISRLFYWQILQSEKLQSQAEQQHFENAQVLAKRGNIYFSDGSILASSNPAFLLYALPKTISSADKPTLAKKLARFLIKDEAKADDWSGDILSKLSQDLYWVQIAKNIDVETKKEIEENNLAGIGFELSSLRFYPEGSSSAQLLGFVGFDERDKSTGYFGVEGFYNGELKGVGGTVKNERDAFGLPILTGSFFQTQAKNGKDLHLNLDRSIQFIVENELKKGLIKYGAKEALAVVMEPKSGAILAMASYPNYDPALYFNFPAEYYKNPAVAQAYEPGSTFKVLVMAAALNEDLVKPDSKCEICSGPIQLGGFTIRTWNNKYFPQESMNDVIVHSDNTGMVFVGQKLGLDKLYPYLEKFGLGKLTNIDLQDEALPPLREKNQWREIDVATASFGQGIAVTPIQMITAVASLANGGKLMEPHVVKSIVEEDQTFEITPKGVGETVKEEVAKVITEMMVKAVSEGEAKWAKPKGFKIAGKTGTAQIPIAGHYDPNKTIASFVGFAPADNPKFAMIVVYSQPQTSIYGSETAAPTFFEIAKELFTYYKIASDE